MSVMLGAVVLVLGAGFILLGVNGWMAGRSSTSSGGADENGDRQPPVPGVGSGTRASSAERKIAATAWLVVGVLFIVAAFTHQLP
jgi:hypothetical protein